MEHYGTQHDEDHLIDASAPAIASNDLGTLDPVVHPEPALDFGASATHGKAKGGKKGATPAEPEVEDVDLKPLGPTHDENKGFMRFMPPLIKLMNRNGVPFNIDGSSGEITIGGFYQNGPMKLEIEANDDIVAIDKRDRRKVLKSYDDLVKLNFDWWRRATGKGNNVNPDRPWLDAFLEKNWVKRQVIFVPRDDQGPTDAD
ncbi:hypothetical protein SAMN05216466_106175 [Paraburkholderia phenazinium]|uniref:Uncharacterized protein n=1 Tax=Paraburkholderia phenazinium TaxID=60549 RepID=A0A1G7YGY7_9BURK|nr:hypothetical protein [Paraburkholderia phenazinium]SDG95525.1 hypothetical protein SAMN05216466_106175 [Paraburkholderia phenazinium]